MIISSFIHKFKTSTLCPLYALLNLRITKQPLTIVVKGFYNYIFYSHSIVLGGLEVMS